LPETIKTRKDGGILQLEISHIDQTNLQRAPAGIILRDCHPPGDPTMNFLILRQYVFGGIALLIAISVTAVAAEYPTRQVRIVVGAVSGGGVDITGRVIAAKLSEQLGQQFFVDNPKLSRKAKHA
jgi:hypothetical protein